MLCISSFTDRPMADTEIKPAHRQCVNCGGVTAHGGPLHDYVYGDVWACAWCLQFMRELFSTPVAPPHEDDRTYPEGRWLSGVTTDRDSAKRRAVIERNCLPLEET
jgi:hypothetical protein